MKSTITRHFKPITAPVLYGLCVLLLVLANTVAFAEEEYTAQVQRYPYSFQEPIVTVVGSPVLHTLRAQETLLDIARIHGLGFNEVSLFYPKLDPWLPPISKTILMPSQWILPPTRHEELVINVPELRLYY